MKKFLPVIIVICLFSTFLVTQVVLDLTDSRAGQFGKSKEKFSLYEDLYQKIDLKDISDRSYKLSNVKEPIVILNFWASWCMPCLKEFPSLVKLKNKLGEDNILILGINTDEENSKKLVKKIETKYGLNFPNVLDGNGELTGKFVVTEIPLSIVFHNGKVIEVNKGEKDYSSLDTLQRYRELASD